MALVTLTRARSAGEGSARSRPLRPTPSSSSWVRASMPCSARAARSGSPPGPGLLQVLLQLAQPAPVRRLRLLIEQAVGLVQPRPPEPGLNDGIGGQPP